MSSSLYQKKFYNSADPGYLKHKKNIPYARYLVGKLLSVLPIPRQAAVLEVGAGQGRFTLELSQHVYRIHATDISRKEIEILKTLSQDITTQAVDLLAKRDVLKGVYDAIIGFFVLHHIDRFSYDMVVSRLISHLKHGRSTLTFIEPNSLYPFHVVEMAIEPDMHWSIEKQIYSDYLKRWAHSCEDAGLKRVVIKKFGFIPPPLINRWPKIVIIDRFIEKIPLVKEILCPFVLVSYSLL